MEIDVICEPARTRSVAALRSLMQAWEQEGAADDSESETELMVLLSGMVSPEIRQLADM